MAGDNVLQLALAGALTGITGALGKEEPTQTIPTPEPKVAGFLPQSLVAPVLIGAAVLVGVLLLKN
jgi:hypothetical protein